MSKPKTIHSMLTAWCGNEEVFAHSVGAIRTPDVGQYVRHHGSLYVVDNVIFHYSAMMDGYEIEVRLRHAPFFELLFKSKVERELVAECAKDRNLSEAAFITKAVRVMQAIEHVVKNNPRKQKLLKELMTPGNEPAGTGWAGID